MSTSPPDVIVVVLDTARRDRFGCYGYERQTTPTVDALAEEGVRYDNVTTSAPWTVPAHASLFTGLYPSEHGAQWKDGLHMRKNVEVTMAEWLRDRGYATVCATNNGLISYTTGLARGFDHYGSRLDLERGWPRVSRRVTKALVGGDSGGAITNKWLAKTLPDIEGPLFLFVNYLECHWSYVPPPRFVRQVEGPRFGPLEGLRYRLGTARGGPWEAIARGNKREHEIYSALYDAELANVDHHLSKLLAILRACGRMRHNQTLLLVTSDHGEHIGDHGLADHHASVSETLTSIPFVVWGPGQVQPGIVKEPFEFTDVFPSVSRFLNGGAPADYLQTRRDHLLTDPHRPGGKRTRFSEWHSWNDKERTRLARRNPSFDFSGLGCDLAAVRNDRFKLVRAAGQGERLFDLEDDPGEERDVADVFPDERRHLASVLTDAQESWGNWDAQRQPLSERDEAELEERLAALGYI